VKRGGNESANEQRKSGLFLSPPSTTLPSCGPCLGSPCSIRFASELSESDALSDDLPNGKIEAASVIQFFAVIEAKHLFVKVAAKMKRFDRNVRPRNAALEKRPEILKAVGVYAAIYVLSRMVNDLMSVIRCQSVVGHERIAVERRASGDVFANFVLQHGLAATRDDGSADLPAPLQDAHDCGFVFRTSASNAALAFRDVHVPRFAADESLIDFDFAAQLGPEEIVLHCKANPLQHKPCRLLGNLNVASNFVATHAVLAVRQHPRCREPLIKRDRRVLIDRPDFDGELSLRVMTSALPSPTSRVECADSGRTATGTNHAVRPASNGDVVDAVVRIREVDDCFLKARRFLVHLRSPLTKMYQELVGESSKLLP